MINIGDNVVNSENLQTGNVIQIDEENNKVEIAQTSGAKAWVVAENVKKLLLETDPAARQQFLNHGFRGHRLTAITQDVQSCDKGSIPFTRFDPSYK